MVIVNEGYRVTKRLLAVLREEFQNIPADIVGLSIHVKPGGIVTFEYCATARREDESIS